ncbi:hypothetical protein Mal15_54300 [Stieleria maiorica]|uniref:Uncharacterized protein n=1 Tax=Stieleria maiorica TaxID=2795974 RepID=A0A5B9MKC5_9BACT|nr:hypothetical protein [Stieleria maiorica]QEG01354.1 hypothetical protein Mal15_54300 [Stieleria maiorica]
MSTPTNQIQPPANAAGQTHVAIPRTAKTRVALIIVAAVGLILSGGLLGVLATRLASGDKENDPRRAPQQATARPPMQDSGPTARGGDLVTADSGGLVSDQPRRDPPSLPATDRLNAFQMDYEKLRQSQQTEAASELDSLTTQIGSPEAFSEQLGRIAKTFPHASISMTLRRIAIESPLWSGVMAWSDLIGQLDSETLREMSPQQARLLIDQGDRLLAAHAIAPFSQAYESLRPRVLKIASRVDLANQRIDARLASFLNEELIGHLLMIQERDTGNRYYLRVGGLSKVERDSAWVRFNYLTDYPLKTQNTRLERNKASYYGPAPHSQLAKRIRDRLSSDEHISRGQWETVFCDLLCDIETSHGVDPLVRFEIYSRLLTVASEGSEPISSAFSKHLQDLKDAAIIDRTARWFSPADDGDKAAIAQSRQFFDRIPSISDAAERAIEIASRKIELDCGTIHWQGWLDTTETSAWRFRGTLPADRSGYLATVYRDKEMAASLSVVGEVSAGSIQWLTTRNDAFAVGRPLFFTSFLPGSK